MYVFIFYYPLYRLDLLEIKLTRDGLIAKKDWYSLQTIKQWKFSDEADHDLDTDTLITQAIFEP